MTELRRNLRHLMSVYGAPGIDVDKAVEDVRELFDKSGYSKISTYFFAFDKRHNLTVFTDTTTPLSEAVTKTARTIREVREQAGRDFYDRLEKDLYTDKVISLKRNILMDMISAILDTPRKESSVDLWKLHIDAALDRLDETVNKVAAKRAAGIEEAK